MTDDEIELTSIDPEIVEAGYPVAELNEAIEFSQAKFGSALEEYDEGDNWSEESPHGFARAMERNVRTAVLEAEWGNFTEAKKEIGDAMNYLLFVQPFSRDGSLRDKNFFLC